jgi:hypothetical protein
VHEHVRAAEQLVQDPLSGGLLDVERQRLLRPVQPHEVAGLAQHGGVVVPGEVAAFGALDLDHAGAEVGELAGRVGRGDGLLQADHGDPVQRQHASSREMYGQISPGVVAGVKVVGVDIELGVHRDRDKS